MKEYLKIQGQTATKSPTIDLAMQTGYTPNRLKGKHPKDIGYTNAKLLIGLCQRIHKAGKINYGLMTLI